MKNNFLKLEEDLIVQHGTPPDEVKEKIDNSFSLIRFLADILELFVPKLIQAIVSLSGGKKED
ncbi:hypothetical protein [Portibacter lacus]|uniref:Uncharacterized protein n=1 Tax=Portibacter lacus TaxID=1099794 RepID=A0AA37WD94_9BACT|nr:hypothetical protein [Portibacter lacus]GLR17726.1 hypothetical protein GCM10007940_23410 [Portibacter lacus]